MLEFAGSRIRLRIGCRSVVIFFRIRRSLLVRIVQQVVELFDLVFGLADGFLDIRRLRIIRGRGSVVRCCDLIIFSAFGVGACVRYDLGGRGSGLNEQLLDFLVFHTGWGFFRDGACGGFFHAMRKPDCWRTNGCFFIGPHSGRLERRPGRLEFLLSRTAEATNMK